MFIVIDRWQLLLDIMDREKVTPDHIWGGTPAIVFASSDEHETQVWLLASGRIAYEERNRYMVMEVPEDDGKPAE